MVKYVAFLRGINSGQNPSQKMEVLRKVFEELGFANVKSFIASGNLIFESNAKDKKSLETKIEKALLKATKVESTTIIRTKDEIENLLHANPFENIKLSSTQKPHVTFLKKRAERDQMIKSKPSKDYKTYGNFQGEVCYVVDLKDTKTPVAMALLEKEFGKKVTTRTWNTVQRIGKLL